MERPDSNSNLTNNKNSNEQQSQLADLLDTYIQSKPFLNDAYIKNLVDKSITLGIPWENIRETFKRFLLQYFTKTACNSIENLDFRNFIDESNFYDQLVVLSIQMENINSAKSASWNTAEYNNNSDDLLNDNDSADYFTNEADTDSEHNITSRLQQLQLQGKQAINKPKPKQQSFQEFYAQSMDRINDKSNLRPIIVDGSDVALSSQSKQVFTLSRVKQVVEYFEKRNHQIYIILPAYRKEQIMSSSSNQADQQVLVELEQKNMVCYSPSKRVGGKRIVCDDDLYILNLAVGKNGIIVSNDNFKRFLNQREDFKLVIEERVLMYSFIDETFIPVDDPLGKNGPSLENFLRIESITNQQYMKRCPYKKKCTYGSKCKFWHPERGNNQSGQQFKTAHQSVLEQAQEQRMRFEIIFNQNSDYEPANSNMLADQLLQTSLNSIQKKVSVSPSSSKDTLVNSTSSKQINTNLKQVYQKQSVGFQSQTFFSDQMERMAQSNDSSILLKKMGPDSCKLSTQTSLNEWSLKTGQNTNTSELSSFGLFNSALNQSDNSLNMRFMSFAQPQKHQQLTQINNLEMSNHSSASSSHSSSSSSLNTNSKVADHQNKSEAKSHSALKAQLKDILKDDNQVEQLMSKYKDETDIEKLKFLANGMSFDF